MNFYPTLQSESSSAIHALGDIYACLASNKPSDNNEDPMKKAIN